MSRTDAMDRAIKKYEQEKIDRILLRLSKGKKAEIQTHASERGESVNAFLNRAVDETMKRDQENKP